MPSFDTRNNQEKDNGENFEDAVFYGGLVSDDQLEALAGVDMADCTRGGTKLCTCGGNASCHHHE